MKKNAYDFCYDGLYLSDYDFTIVNIDDSSGVETVSIGSVIKIDTITKPTQRRAYKTGYHYDSTYTCSFTIAKNPEKVGNNLEITEDEFSDLIRWLNRTEFLQMFFVYEHENNCYYDAIFNIEKVYIGNKLIALQLTMETNRPYGYGDRQVKTLTFTEAEQVKSFNDNSNEIGSIIPDLKITIKDDGDLYLQNLDTETSMTINNCVEDEIISINGEMLTIMSDNPNHQATLADDFDYNFLSIGNSISNRRNRILASIPCVVEIGYIPVIK